MCFHLRDATAYSVCGTGAACVSDRCVLWLWRVLQTHFQQATGILTSSGQEQSGLAAQYASPYQWQREARSIARWTPYLCRHRREARHLHARPVRYARGLGVVLFAGVLPVAVSR